MTASYRGLVLAGRYRLEERIHVNPDAEVWRSVDATLDRTVSVRLMRPGHPFAADVADAARRAALIDDARLVRVLDVGNDGDSAFVVSEYLNGDTLAGLVERSPLPPPAVRRLIGEVAEGLDVAAARGLHHLRLTPRSVMVGADGAVKISGVAVEAAAAGLEPGHAATASRVDAVALVALLYSGLTGRWPLGDAGFPPAPRGEGGTPVPPADLVPGVPNDLDTLCTVTLGTHDDGPRTPGELVAQLAPWPSAEEAPVRALTRRAPRDSPTPAESPGLTLRGRAGSGKRPAKGLFSTGPQRVPVAGAAAAQAEDAAEAGAGAGAGAASDGRLDSLFSRQSAFPAETPVDAATNGHGPTTPVTVRAPATAPPSPARPARPARPTPPAGPAGPPSRGGEDPALDDETTEVPTARRPEPSRDRDTRPNDTRPNHGRPDNTPAKNGRAGNGRAPAPVAEPMVPWGAGWPTEPAIPSRLESTGPFPIIIPPEAPPREQSRLVIVIVISLIVLLLIFAAFSLRDFGGHNSTNTTPVPPGVLPTSAAAAAVTPSASPSPSVLDSTVPTSPTAPTPKPAAVVPQIAGARAIDPEADGDENTADSKLAVDHHPATFWKSATYASAAFGGLKKGVGLVIQLKKPAVVSEIQVLVHGSGGAVELRTANGPTLDSSVVVAKGLINNGRVTMRVDGGHPSGYVILWFTRLPSVGGVYRLEVSEVQLK